MSANNNAKRATIAEIQGKFFEIPPYQRLYEWEKEQIETLLDDMKKAFDESKENYFIGNITTSIKANKDEQDKNNKKNEIYVLIDGQQRLTTIWFIGFYLASNEKCGDWQKKWQEFIIQGNKLRIAMPIRDNEENALKELAKKIIDGKYKFKQDKDNKIAAFKESSNIHQKIIEAFSCIESRFVNGNDKNIDLANFAKYIYENVCFVFVTLAQNTDLNRFFVRMNNRGKQLEKHEILKARMLGAIQKSGGEWQKYAKIWDLCSDMDKYIFQSASDRSIFAPKSQDNNDTKSINDNDSLVKLADIVEKYKIPEFNKSKDKDLPSKVESIIDFPTFLLHCYKLFTKSDIPIAVDKLLYTMWEKQNNFKTSGKYCEDFIKSMLRYRVFFDYFVIKNTLGDDGFAIMRFYESNGSYQPKAKSFENLAMIQNYLRVARQGERQNYHHWLTPFLKFLDNHISLDMILALDETKEFNFDNFKDNAEKIANQFSVANKCNEQEKVLIEFLENLDTKLAIEQLPKESSKNGNENTLLPTSNEILRDLDSVNHFEVDKKFSENDQWSFLKYGNEIRYWFYRLEYYLWKNRYKFKDENFGESKTAFLSIANNFYFRNLNSIEHFRAQSNESDNENWLGSEAELNDFGNLALISGGFNSGLNAQIIKKKEIDIENQKSSESLKLVLMCCAMRTKQANDKSKAKQHKEEMLKILQESLNPNDLKES